MFWQDLLFLSGSLLTVVVLLPTLRNVTARIPLETSLPKAGLAAIYALTFHSLGMTLAAVGLFATALTWSLIACYRSPTGRSVVGNSPSTTVNRPPVSDPTQRRGHEGDRS